MFNVSDVQPIPLLIATGLASHGLRKQSLSPSGALAAFFTGFTMLSVPVRSFGVSLIMFYLIGSRATKVGKALKAQLEEGHQEAGRRTASQVFCNSCLALIASLLWSASFIPGSVASSLLPSVLVIPGEPYDSDKWCPLSTSVTCGWSRALMFLALGHFACCLGDTLASELGILSKAPPISIISFKSVPPGTNGGMSVMGTIASFAGGFLMGLTLVISLAIENSVCRQNWSTELLPLLVWGTLAGGFGSLIDSFLGATIQETRQSSETKRILPDEFKVDSDSEVKVVGGLDVLTNNEVNLFSSIMTGCALARFA